MIINIPTTLTLLRLGLIPVIVFTIIEQSWIAAGCLFFIAALTDVLDGALARYLNQETRLGALLDTVADKLLLISSYLCLAYLPKMGLPLWFILLIILNDLLIVVGGLYWGTLRPTTLGRLSSLGQILFILWYLSSCWMQACPAMLLYQLLLLIILARIAVVVQYSRLLYFRKFS